MKKTCQIKCALKIVLGMFDSIVLTNNVPHNIISTNYTAMKNKNISLGLLTNFNVPIWSNV